MHPITTALTVHRASFPLSPRRREEEEAAKRAAAEAKKQREADKRALKKERQRLRAIAEGGAAGRLLGEDEAEKLCQGLEMAELAALSDAAGADGLSDEQRAAVLEARLAEMRGAEAAAVEERDRQKKEAAAAIKVGARHMEGATLPLLPLARTCSCDHFGRAWTQATPHLAALLLSRCPPAVPGHSQARP